jgi:hypothetical protein
MNAAFSIGSGRFFQNSPQARHGARPYTGATIMHKTARHFILALATGAALTLGMAQAQTPPPANAPQLTLREIYDRVEAAGYRNIREIEHEHGRYKVKAQNAQGARVKLYVNAASGAVEHTRTRD